MLEAYKKSINDVFGSVKKQNDELINSSTVPATTQQENKATQQVNNSTSQQMPKQVPKQVFKQVDNSTSQQVDNLTSQQVDNSTSQQVDNLTSQQFNKSTSQQVDNLTSQQFNNSFKNQIPFLNMSFKPADLKLNQYVLLYEIYFKRPFKVSGLNRIGQLPQCYIAYGTVRYILDSLVKKGYIYKHFPVSNSSDRATTCQVNESKCIPLFGNSFIINSEQTKRLIFQQVDISAYQQVSKSTSQQINKSTSQHINNTTYQQVDNSASQHINDSYISSSSIKKPTTKLNNYNMPEFKFWIETGITEKQICGWMNDFDLDEYSILNFLRYAEFDLIDNKKLDKVPSPPGWFFKTLEKNNSYNKPKNYKSYTQKIKEKEQIEFEKELKEFENLKKIREDREKLVQDMAFEKMLADPEGELYQKCFNNIPDTFKKIYLKKEKRTGKTFYERLKTQFNNIED